MPDARLSISSLTNQEPAKASCSGSCHQQILPDHHYPHTPPSPSDDEHSPSLKKRRTNSGSSQDLHYPSTQHVPVSNCRTCTLPSVVGLGLPNPSHQHQQHQHQQQLQHQHQHQHPPSPSPSSPETEARIPSPVALLTSLAQPHVFPPTYRAPAPQPNMGYYAPQVPQVPQMPVPQMAQVPQYYPPQQQYYYPTSIPQPMPHPTRRKKQCPQCLKFFSNLATHKSTHLSEVARPHTCTECGRGFARPNDLFRHLKSHRGDAPFRCPFFMTKEHQDDKKEPLCHQTGGFSRCDTYKNHLKAMHFEYPVGTKKKDRNGQSGCCRACGMHFDNVDDWVSSHVETRQCRFFQ